MLRSATAILIGFLLIGALSFGADAVLHMLAPTAFDPSGRVESPTILLVTLTYVGIFAIAGCYLTARLAPTRPMLHALILGLLGLIFNIAGTIALWEMAPAWYHLIALALVMPFAWAGGRIREREIEGSRPVSRMHQSPG